MWKFAILWLGPHKNSTRDVMTDYTQEHVEQWMRGNHLPVLVDLPRLKVITAVTLTLSEPALHVWWKED